MQTHVPERQPRGHPVCRCPSWLVGKELELSVPIDQVLGLEFFHKLNRIVFCDNLFSCVPKFSDRTCNRLYWAF